MLRMMLMMMAVASLDGNHNGSRHNNGSSMSTVSSAAKAGIK